MSQDLREFEEKLRQWRVDFVCWADPGLCERVKKAFYEFNRTLLLPVRDAYVEVVPSLNPKRGETRFGVTSDGRLYVQIALPPNADDKLIGHEVGHAVQGVGGLLYLGLWPRDWPFGISEAFAEALGWWYANLTDPLWRGRVKYPDWEKRKELAEQLRRNPNIEPPAAYSYWPAFPLPPQGDARRLLTASLSPREYERYYRETFEEPRHAPQHAPQSNATSTPATAPPPQADASVTQTKPAEPATITPEPYRPTSRDEEYWWLPQHLRPQIVQADASGGGQPKALRAEVHIEGFAPWYLKVGDREVFIGYAPRREGQWPLGWEFEVEVPAKAPIYAPGGGTVTAERLKLSFERRCEGDKCYLVPRGATAVAGNYSKGTMDVRTRDGAVEVVDWPLQAGQGGPKVAARIDAETLAKAVAEAVKKHPEFGVGMYNFPDVEKIGKLVVESPGGTAIVQPVWLGGKILVGHHVSPAVVNPVEVRGGGRVEVPIYARGLTFEDIQRLVQEGRLPGQPDVVEGGVVLRRQGDRLYIYYRPEGSPIGVDVAVAPTWRVGDKAVAGETAYVADRVKFPGEGEWFKTTDPWPPPEKVYDLSLVQKYATESGKFVTRLSGAKFLDGSVGDKYILWEVRGDRAVPRYECTPQGCREVSAVVWPSIDYPVEVWHRGNVVWRGTAGEFDRVVRGGGLDLRHGQGEPIPGLSTAPVPTPQPNATAPSTTPQNATAPPRVNVTQTLPQISATATTAVPNVTATVTQNVATETVKSPQTSPQLDLGKVAEELRRRLAGAPRWLAQGFADFARIQAENIPRFAQQAGQFLYSVGADVAAKAAEAAKAAASQVISVVQNLTASTAAKAQTIPPELEREDVEERQVAPAKPRKFSALPSVTALRRAAAVETPRRPVDYVVEEQKRREEQLAAQRAEERRQRDESERYVRKLAAETRTEKPREESPQQAPRQEGARKEESRPPPQVMRKLAKLQPV